MYMTDMTTSSSRQAEYIVKEWRAKQIESLSWPKFAACSRSVDALKVDFVN